MEVLNKKKLETIDSFNPNIELYTEDKVHLSDSFKSGINNFAFDNYIKELAIKDKESGEGVTYIVTEIKNNKEVLIAYYTISASNLHVVDNDDFEDDDLPNEEKRERYWPISAFRISMFAVSEDYQDCLFNGTLVADHIFRYILCELLYMSKNVIGAQRIILAAVPDAVDFYKRNNFEELTLEYTLLDKADVSDYIPMFFTI